MYPVSFVVVVLFFVEADKIYDDVSILCTFNGEKNHTCNASPCFRDLRNLKVIEKFFINSIQPQ